MARKNKYETHVKPFLDIIASWSRNGAPEEEIAKKLDVAYSTFRQYKAEHEELQEVMRLQREHADLDIENALFKKAKGHIVSVKKAFKCREVYYDDHGRRCEKEEIKTAEEDMYIPPDTVAAIFYLKNRKPEVWKDMHNIQHSATEAEKSKLDDLIRQMSGDQDE